MASPSLRPTRKVSAGAIAGFAQAAFVWLWNGRNMQPPITAELASAAVPIFTFAIQWLVPEKDLEE